MRFDIWRYAFGLAAGDATERAQQVTRQTGEVLTPTASPDGAEIAYLSDDGGHSNVWVTSARGSPRQITFERDPTVTIGVPIWSPDGRWIAFVSTKGNTRYVFGVWLVRPDGSDLHQLVPTGLGAAWSSSGDALYDVESSSNVIKRVPVGGGPPVTVRPDVVRNLIGVHESTVSRWVAGGGWRPTSETLVHLALVPPVQVLALWVVAAVRQSRRPER